MRSGKVFYGWVNLAVLWVLYFLTIVPFTYAYGIIAADMSSSLGLSMTVIGGVYTCYSLTGSLLAPGLGKLIGRIGAKRTILIGCALMASAALLMGYVVRGAFLYYVVWITMFSVGIRASALIPAQDNLSKWFFNKRGLAMSILLTAGGIGGFVLMPVLRAVSEAYSWRGVWLFLAGMDALAMLLVAVVLKDRPENVGQRIDNGEPAAVTKSSVRKSTDPWTVKKAMRQPSFYMLVLVFFTASYLMVSVGNYAILHLTQRQVSGAVAAAAVSIFALINTAGRLLAGALSGRVNIKILTVAGAVCAGLGNAVMLLADKGATATAALVLIGVGYGLLMVIPQNLLADFFGTLHYSEINGVFCMFSGILSSLPAVIIGAMFDLLGNYAGAWYLGAALSLLTVVVICFMRQPRFPSEA